MSIGAPASAGQVARIARLLGVEPGEVHGLDDVPAADLRELHDQMSRALFGDAQKGFASTAALAGKLPTPIVAKLAQKAIPPMMAARICEALDPDKGGDLVARLDLGYLTDVACRLDPVAARPVLRAISPERIGAISRELYRRGEYAVLAEFAAVIRLDGLREAMAAATPDDLRVLVPQLTWTNDLDTVIADMSPERLHEITTTLDGGELAELAAGLEPRHLGSILGELDDATLVAVVEAWIERGEHATVGRFADVVSEHQLGLVLDTVPAADLVGVLPHLTWTDTLATALSGLTPERRAEVRDVVSAAVDDGVLGQAVAEPVLASVG